MMPFGDGWDERESKVGPTRTGFWGLGKIDQFMVSP